MAASLNLLLNQRSHKTLKMTGIVLILIGIVGIALPQFLSMAIALFAGWLLLFAGSIAMFMTWHGFRERWVAWLKPFRTCCSRLAHIAKSDCRNRSAWV